MSALSQVNHLWKLSGFSRSELINEISCNYSDSSQIFCINLIKRQSIDKNATVIHIGRERAKRVYIDILNKNDRCSFSQKYFKVGWIIGFDQGNCLLCFEAFTKYQNRRHHCRACGNLVCSSCSPHRSLVEDLESLGRLRVCNECINESFINDQNQEVIKLVETIDTWGEDFMRWDGIQRSPSVSTNGNNEYVLSPQGTSMSIADEYFIQMDNISLDGK